MIRTNIASAFCGLSLLAAPAIAKEITLNSLDNNISISGELLEFDGKTYRVKSIIGEFEIAAETVTCEGEACPEIKDTEHFLKVATDNQLARQLMPSLMSAYFSSVGLAQKDEKVAAGETVVNYAGSGEEIGQLTLNKASGARLFDRLKDNGSDVVFSTREILNSEQRRLEEAGLAEIRGEKSEHVFGLDGLVLVSSPDIELESISVLELARVFSGQITNWSELGGPDKAISLYVPGRASNSWRSFDSLIMRPDRARLSRDANQMDALRDISIAVEKDSGALGLTTFSAKGNLSPLSVAEACGIRTAPDAFTIKTEEYPLAFRLYAYNNPTETSAETDSFINFLENNAAQAVIEEAGFVSGLISSLTVNQQGNRFASIFLPSDEEIRVPDLRDMMERLISAKRLSTTVRFEQASTRLDVRGIADLKRLAVALESGEISGKELIIAGFTDSVGRGDLNRNLSARRAQEVRTALLGLLSQRTVNSMEINAFGYGEVAPLACNDSFNGRRINRRVEMWLK